MMFAIVASMVVMLVPSAMAEDNYAEIRGLNAEISTLVTENIALETFIADATQKNMDRVTAIHAYQEKADAKQSKIDTRIAQIQEMDAAAPLSRVQGMVYDIYNNDIVQSQSELNSVLDEINQLVDEIASTNGYIVYAQSTLDSNVEKITHLEYDVYYLEALSTDD